MIYKFVVNCLIAKPHIILWRWTKWENYHFIQNLCYVCEKIRASRYLYLLTTILSNRLCDVVKFDSTGLTNFQTTPVHHRNVKSAENIADAWCNILRESPRQSISCLEVDSNFAKSYLAARPIFLIKMWTTKIVGFEAISIYTRYTSTKCIPRKGLVRKLDLPNRCHREQPRLTFQQRYILYLMVLNILWNKKNWYLRHKTCFIYISKSSVPINTL